MKRFAPPSTSADFFFRTSQRGKPSSEREIHPTVFSAFSAVPLTYSGKSMASPSSLAPLTQGSLSGRWAL